MSMTFQIDALYERYFRKRNMSTERQKEESDNEEVGVRVGEYLMTGKSQWWLGCKISDRSFCYALSRLSRDAGSV